MFVISVNMMSVLIILLDFFISCLELLVFGLYFREMEKRSGMIVSWCSYYNIDDLQYVDLM